MKLTITKREIADITITDDEVTVALELQVLHGQVKKVTTPITVEHSVPIAELLGDENSTGVDDAIVMAVAGVNQRADEALKAIGGLTEL